MLVDARSLEDGASFDADVCVLGGGAAGITLARDVARRTDLSVVLVESGGFDHGDSDTTELYDGHIVGEPLMGGEPLTLTQVASATWAARPTTGPDGAGRFARSTSRPGPGSRPVTITGTMGLTDATILQRRLLGSQMSLLFTNPLDESHPTQSTGANAQDVGALSGVMGGKPTSGRRCWHERARRRRAR